MNKDIRLLVSFKGHRKRIKLHRLLGAEAVLGLIDLWLTIAQDAPDGDISTWDEEDIAIAAGYEGNPGALRDALLACGFLEKTENGKFSIHDWSEHQGWACKAKQRSEAAKLASEYRWAKRKNHLKKCSRNPNAIRGAIRKASEGYPPSPSPSPSPSPLLKKHITAVGGTKVHVEKKHEKRRCKIPDDFELDEKLLQLSAKHGFSTEKSKMEFIHFKAHHQGKGTLMLNWEKAWLTWILNSKRWERNGNKLQDPIPSQGQKKPWNREDQAREERRAFEISEAIRKQQQNMLQKQILKT